MMDVCTSVRHHGNPAYRCYVYLLVFFAEVFQDVNVLQIIQMNIAKAEKEKTSHGNFT